MNVKVVIHLHCDDTLTVLAQTTKRESFAVHCTYVSNTIKRYECIELFNTLEEGKQMGIEFGIALLKERELATA